MTDATSQFRQVLGGLLEKARRDEVNWQRSAELAGITYKCVLPASSIAIQYVSPFTDPDYYAAYVFNNRREMVFNLRSSNPQDEDWDTLAGLWRDAERCFTGWDRALADVQRALDTYGKIGEPDIPSD